MIDFTYIDIDETPIESEINPEKTLLKKEKVTCLSKEAQTILSLIINSPSELIMFSRPKTNKELSVQDIQTYLEKAMGKSIRAGRKIIKELRAFAYGNS